MKSIVLIIGLALAASPAIGWREISCMGPQQENTYKVPDTCADRCTPDLMEQKVKGLDPSYRTYYAGEYAKYKKGAAFAYPGLELCRVNEWACANKFTLKVECGDNGAYRWTMEKVPGAAGSWLRITPLPYADGVHSFPGLIVSAYDVNQPWPAAMTKRNERPRGGYDEQVRRVIEEGSLKGVIETDVILDIDVGPNNTTVTRGRHRLKGFLHAGGLSGMIDYTETHPYTLSLEDAEAALRSFMGAQAQDGLKIMELCAAAPAKP